jgi:hypothetical protein
LWKQAAEQAYIVRRLLALIPPLFFANAIAFVTERAVACHLHSG